MTVDDDATAPPHTPIAAAAELGMLDRLFSQRCADDPVPVYRELHEQCPVTRAEGMAGVAAVYLTRYEDVAWALKSPDLFSSGSEALAIGQEQPLIPLQVDPPDHRKYRRVLDPEFSPTRMAAIEDDSRALVNKLIDAFADADGCDFHEDFATPLPSTIFLRLMGLPQSDLAMFLQWRDNTIRPDVAPGDMEGAARIREQTGHEVTAYFQAAIDERRRRPDASAVLGRLVATEMEGRPLSDEELLGICHLLMLGGLDTVTATLDCAIAYLARHPDRRDALVADTTLVAGAVEELLRAESPVMVVPRVVTRDTTVGGVEVKAGDHATICIGAANSDQAEFDDVVAVDFARNPNRHLAFGGGPHRCLGSHLARMELRLALEEFHRRVPAYAIPDGTDIHYSPGIRQADRLPLVFG